MRIGASLAAVGIGLLLAAGGALAQGTDTGAAPAPAAPTQAAPTQPQATPPAQSPAQAQPAPPAQVPTPAQTALPAQTPAQAQAAPPAQAPAPGPVDQPAPNAKYRSKEGELRAAALIGTTVYNDQKQSIGTISDLLIDKDSKVAKAVLSVGGFLGVGSRLVAVPFANLQIEPDRVVLPGATKVSLENLSAFQSGG